MPNKSTSSSQIEYSAIEAAYYARLRTATVRSWIRGGLAVEGNEDELSFHEFVQLLAVRTLRQKGISLKKIQKTMEFIRKECDIKYPFASLKHKTYTEGKDLYIEIEGESGVFSATGKLQRQLNFKPIVELYMTQLEFDEDGLAKKFKAFQHEGQVVTLAPDEYYGQPIIAGSPYTAFHLANAVESEGGIAEAAEIYGVEKEKVIAAVAYVDHLSTKPTQPTNRKSSAKTAA